MKIIVDKMPELKSECPFVERNKGCYICIFYKTLRNPMHCMLKSDENGNPWCPFLKEEENEGA